MLIRFFFQKAAFSTIININIDIFFWLFLEGDNYMRNLFSVITEAIKEIAIFFVKLWLSTKILINKVLYRIKVFFFVDSVLLIFVY